MRALVPTRDERLNRPTRLAPFADARPRSFAWIKYHGQYFPQIVFDNPRVGPPMTPVFEVLLQPEEYALTLDQLVQKYPAPTEPSNG
jgi:hypothetical protein